jgi:hypothetical protein
MSRGRTLVGAFRVLLCVGVAFAGAALLAPARAQYGYPCPPGYYYYPSYGCVPPNYFYGPPYYAYPDFGFDFFYGSGWGRRWGGSYGHGGGAYHGGAPHGGGGGHGGGHSGHH